MVDLVCPFCHVAVRDESFKSHVIQVHPEEQGRVGGSYLRWLEWLRLMAGGDVVLGLGQGDGKGEMRK